VKRVLTPGATSGFTLFEMMIAVAVLAVAIIGIYSTVQRAGGIYSENSTITYLEATAGDVMEKLMEEVSFANPIAVDADGNGMTFWIPIDADGANGPLDASGNVEWGYDDNLNYKRKLSFVAREELSEATLKQDINADGDKSDRFQTGWLTVETLDASGTRVGARKTLSPPIFIVTYPTAGLDSNGDGMLDPIYSRVGADGETISATGPMLRICLVVASQDGNRKWHMMTKSVSIRLRNIPLGS
jgi:prepilin-type N-terminal cleavage/methylation domain-containing protein